MSSGFERGLNERLVLGRMSTRTISDDLDRGVELWPPADLLVDAGPELVL
ncbi:MAG: hypothetical protein ACPHO4_05015 [Longimicrobiales bacterium]